MKNLLEFDPKHAGLLDYSLTLMVTALAVFAGVRSLAYNGPAWPMVGLAAAGTVLSFFVSRALRGSKLRRYDAIVYAVLVFAAFVLNPRYIDETDTATLRYLYLPTALTWVLVFGSFGAYRDSTLLFQILPAIALYGLVGAFDTYSLGVLSFFAFMICVATLLGRAHARSMVRQAEASGYTRTDTLYETVWRWMAGSEWALASGAAIVLLSFLGAPVVRQSLKGVSGQLKFYNPVRPRMADSTTPSLFAPSDGVEHIGIGPNHLSPAIVAYAKLDELRYLRSTNYSVYSNGSWFREQRAPTLPAPIRHTIAHPEEIPFGVEVVGNTYGSIPMPGQFVTLDPNPFVTASAGGIRVPASTQGYPLVSGRALVSASNSPARDAELDLPVSFDDYVNPDTVPKDVRDLAQEVTAGAKNDWDKATSIVAAIQKHGKYNLNAARTPTGLDPVSNFLFTSHEGYCDLFASSMVLMARSVGIPARYVTGYLPDGDQRNSDGAFIVRESDGHAWAELLFQGSGWVVFDPTTGAEAVPGGEQGQSTEGPWYLKSWFLLGVVPVLGVVGAIAVVPLVGRVRRMAAERAHPRRRVGRAYARLERVLQGATRKPRRLAETPREFLDGGKDGLGETYGAALMVVESFEQALYAVKEPDDERCKHLESQVSTLAKSIRRTRGANGKVGAGKGQ